jgi:putative SOS response-associated peptidase YedK
MCGRYTLKANPSAVATLFDVSPFLDCKPRYNVAPSQSGADAMKVRTWTEAERRQCRRTAKRLKLWRMSDGAIAKRTGRTARAVRQKRELIERELMGL